MNNNTASQFMDKQIMDLSNSQSSTANNNSSHDDFIDFMNRPSEDHNRSKDDILPSYDFLPIRPTGGSASPPPPRTMNFDSGNDDAPLRTWNSLDSKTNSSTVRNYGSLDVIEPAKDILEKDRKVINVSLISEIDRVMKKYADNIIHAMDGVSARLSQLETRTRNIENSVDDLKLSVGNNYGSADGKLRLLENILREVQTGVQFIKDKQEIVEAQLQISKLQVSNVEHPVENPNTARTEPNQPIASAHHQSPRQLSTAPFTQTQPTSTLTLPNAPPPLTPRPNVPSQVQLPNQYSQNQVPSVPQRDSYFPPPGQTPENPSQQYQTPPLQPQQSAPLPRPVQQQYQPPQLHYSQQPPPTQPHSTMPPVNPSQPQLPLSRHSEEAPYIQPSTYPPNFRPPGPPPLHPSSGAPPPQQFYGSPPNIYEPASSRTNSGYSGSYDLQSGPGEPYYSGPPSQYGSGSPVKAQQPSSSMLGQSGGSGYPQLPTARILPQALPTASGVGGGPGSAGAGNRVPLDDVVDKVTNMGFPRDQVKATVRKLTESGQSVDLNVVLDKLMNDGDGQGRSWFGR